jgi:hypothetical protein
MPVMSAEAARERFIVALDRLSGSNPLALPTIAEVAREVGVSSQEACVIALHLEGRGWVKTSLNSESGGTVGITTAGVEAAEHLRLPRWSRWMKDRAIIAAIVSAVLSALLTAIFTRLIVGH